MDQVKLTWEEIEALCWKLSESVKKSGYEPEVLIAIARGGWIPARMLSDMLNIRKVASIGLAFYISPGVTEVKPKLTPNLNISIKGMKVLLIDDVADSGESLILAKQKVLELHPGELKVATLHKKPRSKFTPDFFATETSDWLIYPWEKKEFGKSVCSQ